MYLEDLLQNKVLKISWTYGLQSRRKKEKEGEGRRRRRKEKEKRRKFLLPRTYGLQMLLNSSEESKLI